MQRRSFNTGLLGMAAAVATGFQGSAWAQAWPARPIKWILSQPAGSGPDILARFVAENLSRRLGQPIVVDNRPGGQNVIGAQAAMRSPADGYTFYYATTAAEAAGGALFTGTGDVDLEGATHEVDVLGLSDRILSLLGVAHGHEGEAAGTTRELVHHDFHGDHFASLGEVSADVGFGSGPGQIAHEQFVFHIFCLFCLVYLRRIARFRPSDFDLPS